MTCDLALHIQMYLLLPPANGQCGWFDIQNVSELLHAFTYQHLYAKYANRGHNLKCFFLYHPTNLGCGIVNKKHRIVGGHETEVNQYPWMGLLQYGGRFYCGCSLINDRYVLTGKLNMFFSFA